MEENPIFEDVLINHIIESLITNRNAIAEDLSMNPLPRICYYSIKYCFLVGCLCFMVKFLHVYKATNEMLEDLLQQSVEDLAPKSKRKGRPNKFGDYALFLRVEKLKLLKVAKQSLSEMRENINSLERVFDNWSLVFLVLTPAVGISMITDPVPLPKDALMFTVVSNVAVMAGRIYVNERIRGEKLLVYAKLLKLMKTCCHERFCRNMKRQLTFKSQQPLDKSSSCGFDIDVFLLAAILDTACMIVLIVVNQ